jgi:tRNA(Arg) A34 adenosine deaminase TadA
MCASAIRWAGFKEVIYGSSIKTIAKSKPITDPKARADFEDGRNQIYIPSTLIWEKSYSLGHATLM